MHEVANSIARTAVPLVARVVVLVACGALVLAGCNRSSKDEKAEVPTSETPLPPATGTAQTSPLPGQTVPAQNPPTAGQAAPTPTFPPAFTTVGQGDRASAVYVAVARDGRDPKLARAQQDLRAAGYKDGTGEGDVDCDQGARAALQLSPDTNVKYTAVAVYFRTRQQATQFVGAFKPGVVGTADVEIFCAD